MSEKTKEPKPVVFILLPQPGKALFKGSVFAWQEHAVVENGQQIKAEQTGVLSPDGFGIYQWMDNDPHHKENLFAMKGFMERKNKGKKFIAGPFDCRQKALEQMDKLREKAPEEENTILKAQAADKDKEIAELKEKIAKATKSSDK